jgi:hypothetical protein
MNRETDKPHDRRHFRIPTRSEVIGSLVLLIWLVLQIGWGFV